MIRVFPRKTNASPNDDESFYGLPPVRSDFYPTAMISCTFTYDRTNAEWLAKKWEEAGYNAVLGGPAYGSKTGYFVPGRYLKPGLVITSRGCNNNCWFCSVPKQEGPIRPITITWGWNVLDSNLLQCPEWHVRKVFEMLKKQVKRPVFTGGLEAILLKEWHIELLVGANTERVYFAYDEEDDYEPLVVAAKKMRAAGFKYQRMSCYVLIGYPRDTISKAEERLNQVVKLGIMPFAMLWRNDKGDTKREWRKFQRHWAAPAAVGTKMKAAGW